MQANQKLIASDGKEIFLFPCDAMYLTPARVPPEHDVLALDFLPRDTNGNKITGMKCYAPFSGTIVYTGADHNFQLYKNARLDCNEFLLQGQYMNVQLIHASFLVHLECVLHHHFLKLNYGLLQCIRLYH